MTAGFDFALPSHSAADPLTPFRARVAAAHRADEATTVRSLVAEAKFPPDVLATVNALATRLATAVRAERSQAGGVDALMLEFSLDSREGVALMCVAEALLRIPDAATRDRLIRDKIGGGDWRAHVGASPSCSSMPLRGGSSSPDVSSTPATRARWSRRSRRCSARAASR